MVFVENLSLVSWLMILSFWFRWKDRESRTLLRLRYFRASACGKKILALLRRLEWVTGEEVDYSFVDGKYSDGYCLGRRVLSKDMLEVCRSVRLALFEESPVLKKLKEGFDRGRLLIYLEKCLGDELTTTLIQVKVVSWHQRSQGRGINGKAIFFVARKPWNQQLEQHAQRERVSLHTYGFSWWMPKIYLRAIWRIWKSLVTAATGMRTVVKPTHSPMRDDRDKVSNTVAVSYQGKGVTLDLSRNSDVSWVQFANLSAQQGLVYFSWSEDPLDEEKLSALEQAGMRAVAMNESASASPRAVVWRRKIEVSGLSRELGQAAALVACAVLSGRTNLGVNLWVAFNLLLFVLRYNERRCFFADFNVKIYVDYEDRSKDRLPASEAIRNLGGISVSYQRGDESEAHVFRARGVDVHFGYSTALVEVERRSHSRIDHFVAVGYILDHAFSRVRCRASQLRRRLMDRGARFIVTFLDEGSVDDKRTGPSHEYRAENYRFLLAKLLADSDLGVVFKPKKPATLRRRLGPVAKMLDEALATGRCFLFEGGTVATPNLPCEASQAADVAIGLLFGASAALESALGGTPTLLLDREGLPFHPLYRLGEGKVVFQDWDSLWKALSAYRRDPSPLAGVGRWSGMEILDPFRDGRAAERMGEYIGWLAGGLSNGLPRDETLKLARQRYASLWGPDKITDIT